MAENHEAEDVNGNPLLTKDEVERLERFYGQVDPLTKKVKLRWLNVPLYSDKNDKRQCVGETDLCRRCSFLDWGRFESPTEPQFRSLEAQYPGWNQNDALRRTLIAIFERAKKNKVAFADLVQEEIGNAKKTQ